jgi:hypothetical protein
METLRQKRSEFPTVHNHYYCFNQQNGRKEKTKTRSALLTFT